MARARGLQRKNSKQSTLTSSPSLFLSPSTHTTTIRSSSVYIRVLMNPNGTPPGFWPPQYAQQQQHSQQYPQQYSQLQQQQPMGRSSQRDKRTTRANIFTAGPMMVYLQYTPQPMQQASYQGPPQQQSFPQQQQGHWQWVGAQPLQNATYMPQAFVPPQAFTPQQPPPSFNPQQSQPGVMPQQSHPDQAAENEKWRTFVRSSLDSYKARLFNAEFDDYMKYTVGTSLQHTVVLSPPEGLIDAIEALFPGEIGKLERISIQNLNEDRKKLYIDAIPPEG
ncbi:hypothetical protein BU16DRAFT_580264 [Lophium mytilinum]|uniref:Uncharacterized protein n=1 Tax=Lophium mytilinum TaxID=390894 RepID=A0A6A6QZD6_9PEZI|nr:hypothetical protein BU16DRAFT_580264 [Lophium mytilinum]